MKLYVLISEPWDLYERDYSYDYVAKVHAVFTDEDEAEQARHDMQELSPCGVEGNRCYDVQAVEAPEGVRLDA